MRTKFYRKLKPITEGNRKYRYITTKDISIKLIGPLSKHATVYFRDGSGKCWAYILEGYIHITEGYAWNGCSPKYFIGTESFGKWIGTPDFEKTILPSLVHDVLFQFGSAGHYKMEDANLIFYDLMEAENFLLAEVYYVAVQKLGIAFFGKKDDNVFAKYIEL